MHVLLIALAINTAPASGLAAQEKGLSVPVAAGKGCPSLASIDRWAQQWARTEPEASLIDNSVFCGDFDGDRRADAIAFVNYTTGGNSQNHVVALFHNAQGRLQYLRTVTDILGEPRSAAFGHGIVALDMTTMRPSDARCCPSGRTRTLVNVATGTHKP